MTGTSDIVVVDYGLGNLASVVGAIRSVGGRVEASASAERVAQADRLVIPGVASFDAARRNLADLGLDTVIRHRAEAGTPLLGICLGMQLLFDRSDEGEMPGLGLLPGRVERFALAKAAIPIRLPHIGWNNLRLCASSPLLEGLAADVRVYFLHSFHCDLAMPEIVRAEAMHGYWFPAVVQRRTVFGAQFHPEKSLDAGARILRNFVEMDVGQC